MDAISKQTCPSLRDDQIAALHSVGTLTIMQFILGKSNVIKQAASLTNTVSHNVVLPLLTPDVQFVRQLVPNVCTIA
jgi:hypothetical protein